MKRLLLFFSVLGLIGCKTYPTVKYGFIVKGDDRYISVEDQVSITVDSVFLSEESWKTNRPPLKASKLTRKQSKILNQLGYPKDNYKVVFTNTDQSSYELICLTNIHPIQQNETTKLFNPHNLNTEEKGKMKIYYEQKHYNNNDVLHIIVPVNETIFNEKFITLVYIGKTDESSFLALKDIALKNAENYQTYGYSYFPMKNNTNCDGTNDINYYNYTIPESITKNKQHIIIKALDENANRRLAYYTLINPGQTLGAFKICPGEFTIEYLSLEGEILKSEKVIIQ